MSGEDVSVMAVSVWATTSSRLAFARKQLDSGGFSYASGLPCTRHRRRGAGMNLDHIPPELQTCPNWVCGRADKSPVDPKTGKDAKADDPSTWGSYEEAVNYLHAHRENGIRSVGFEAGHLDAMNQRYQPDKLKDGYNRLPDGEELFYISNPALGLWALRSQF